MAPHDAGGEVGLVATSTFHGLPHAHVTCITCVLIRTDLPYRFVAGPLPGCVSLLISRVYRYPMAVRFSVHDNAELLLSPFETNATKALLSISDTTVSM